MYDWYETMGYYDDELLPEAVDVRWLCESQMIYLRPDHLYQFKVHPECKKCKELAAIYD